MHFPDFSAAANSAKKIGATRRLLNFLSPEFGTGKPVSGVNSPKVERQSIHHELPGRHVLTPSLSRIPLLTSLWIADIVS